MKDIEISKFLSLILRHHPEKLGITLDHEGWANVAELLQKLEEKGMPVTLDQLKQVVATNSKQRFIFSPDLSCIRANQGHSISVDVGLVPSTPPEVLYHGTSVGNAPSIQREGIMKRTRLHVHLSSDSATATQVGSRHGKPFLFLVKSGEMHRNGIEFFLSENKVWLTDYVAPEYLEEWKG